MRPTPNHAHYATVLEWYDGDTVKLDVDQDYREWNKDWHRLYGVDTPELTIKGQANPFGYAALDYCRAWAPVGTPLIIVSYKAKNQVPTSGAKEKYGRWLAEIWLAENGWNEPSLNVCLVRDGISKHYTGGKR